ncbi:MAG TPA: translation initiation factor IF-1 [Sphingomonas sp.]|nr:translation initiation factor IF-1 [Sphingomonas sp.]
MIRLDGMIEEIPPDGRCRVALENEHRSIVYTGGKMRKYRIRPLLGDRGQVEMSPYDVEKGERVAGTGSRPRRGNRR